MNLSPCRSSRRTSSLVAASISGVASASRPRKSDVRQPDVRCQAGARRLVDRHHLVEQRERHGQLPREQRHDRACRQCQGKHAERTGITRQLDDPRRQHVQGLVVPQECGDAGCEPQPPTPLPSGDVLASEDVDRPSQRRRSCGVSLCDQQRQAIQQQIGRTRRLRRRRRCSGGPRDLQHALVARQNAGGEHGGERFQIGVTREPRIEWFESLGGGEQQLGSVPAAVDGKLDLAAEQVDLGVLEFGQWS